MKVQLRRWFAIGITSGALAVSMLAGSGAVGAAANADAQYVVVNTQRDIHGASVPTRLMAPTK